MELNGVKNVLKNNNVKNIKLNLVYILLDYKNNSKKFQFLKWMTLIQIFHKQESGF